MTDIEQLTFDFALMVAGWKDFEIWHAEIFLTDWNATITAIEARGWEWKKNYSAWLPAVGEKKIRVGTFSVRIPPQEKGPSVFWYSVDQIPGWNSCIALMCAAVKAARSEG